MIAAPAWTLFAIARPSVARVGRAALPPVRAEAPAGAFLVAAPFMLPANATLVPPTRIVALRRSAGCCFGR